MEAVEWSGGGTRHTKDGGGGRPLLRLTFNMKKRSKNVHSDACWDEETC